MLTQTWLNAEQEEHGLNEKQSRELLNASLGTKYTHGNLDYWKKGRTPQLIARKYMLMRCLKWYLAHELPKRNLSSESDLKQVIEDLL